MAEAKITELEAGGESRTSLVRTTLSEFMPFKTLQDFYAKEAVKQGVVVDQLSPSNRKCIQMDYQDYDTFNQRLIHKISQKQIADTDMHDYVFLVYGIASEITQPGRDVTTLALADLVRLVNSIEQARLYQRFTHVWREKFLSGSEQKVWIQRKDKFLGLISKLSHDPIRISLGDDTESCLG